MRTLQNLPGVTDCRQNTNEEGAPDVSLKFRGVPLTIECKNVLRNAAPKAWRAWIFKGRALRKTDPCSRYYSPNDFDVVAACLHAVDEQWTSNFVEPRQLDAHAKCKGKISNNVRVDDRGRRARWTCWRVPRGWLPRGGNDGRNQSFFRLRGGWITASKAAGFPRVSSRISTRFVVRPCGPCALAGSRERFARDGRSGTSRSGEASPEGCRARVRRAALPAVFQGRLLGHGRGNVFPILAQIHSRLTFESFAKRSRQPSSWKTSPASPSSIRTRGLRLVLEQIQKINRAEGTNYRPAWKILRAVEYGVPQLRERLFLVAFRDGAPFEFPKPKFTAPRTERISLRRSPPHGMGRPRRFAGTGRDRESSSQRKMGRAASVDSGRAELSLAYREGRR